MDPISLRHWIVDTDVDSSVQGEYARLLLVLGEAFDPLYQDPAIPGAIINSSITRAWNMAPKTP